MKSSVRPVRPAVRVPACSTANSMNCLTEALGLSLPGERHRRRHPCRPQATVPEGGRTAVELCKRYYEQDDASVLPRSIATRGAFENAMTLDVAMGGSTNTVLHILAAARKPGSISPWPISTAFPARFPLFVQGGADDRQIPHRGCASCRRHHGHSGELDRAGLLHRDRRPSMPRRWARRSTAGMSCVTRRQGA